MRLGDIAARLGCEVDGDPDIEIRGVARIESAEPGDLTFVANRKYVRALRSTRASAVLLSPAASSAPIASLRSANPYLDFARAVELFHPPPGYAPGIHPTAVVAPSAVLGPDAHVGPYCFIDEDVAIGAGAVLHSFVAVYRGARIGDDFFAHSHAVVRESCRVGHRVILQNGAVVGSDGFGFARESDGRWRKIPQVGATVIEDDVEIQAHSAVDRASLGETRVGQGTKIDNLVQVGHHCSLGENVLLCGQVGLAGSTRVGDGSMLGGQVGCTGHLTIGEDVTVNAHSLVVNDVPKGATYTGYPAMDSAGWRKAVLLFARLPELRKEVRDLLAEVGRLKGMAALEGDPGV